MKKFLTTLISIVIFGVGSTPANAAEVKKYKNCTALNKDYPGGISKTGATDTSKKGGKIVPANPKKTPTVDDAIYAKNKGLDRDKDGIACEK